MLPPYFRVPDPGDGIDPLVPQNLSLNVPAIPVIKHHLYFLGKVISRGKSAWSDEKRILPRLNSWPRIISIGSNKYAKYDVLLVIDGTIAVWLASMEH